MPTRPTLLIADHHPVVRLGLEDFFGNGSGFRVIASAPNAHAAVQLSREHLPRILLMEVEMPGRDPIGAIADIKNLSPQTHVVIFAARCHDLLIEEALRQGVAGYLLKSDALADLKESLNAVLRGTRVFSKEVAARVSSRDNARADAATPLAALHPRELEVLRYIGRGMSNTEMAKVMHISLRTVERHVLRLMRSLKIDERTRLTALAHRSGLVT